MEVINRDLSREWSLCISNVVDQLYLAFLRESTLVVRRRVGKCSILVGKLYFTHSVALIVGNECGWNAHGISSLSFHVTCSFVSQPPICVPF